MHFVKIQKLEFISDYKNILLIQIKLKNFEKIKIFCILSSIRVYLSMLPTFREWYYLHYLEY